MPEIKVIMLGGVVLASVVVLWALIHYIFLNPKMEEPDGKARITGSCGDTMELYLKFKEGKVVDTSYWTDGCTYSFNCLVAAADLAKGKTPEEIIEIDANKIKEYVGDLPSDHFHCAKLAEETLQAALDDYMKKLVKQEKEMKKLEECSFCDKCCDNCKV